ncbi:protein-associating with the carboxyl-terminal domain of ezrin isoform 2 [Homo sapiens]|uniref:Protein-associating with the carboxyl-terminal domain of ezrin n=2 Tax=Homo sapiens TaxID=9606 RepID=PACE1_HUMAN|nr:protein-associating with the carboxyl-terminal domain of ezrin isoform 2 [Homo sapiens]XP_006711528.1 protein-associating with the carboxyl-terminal domain of ezrin isoform X1 [Homo sapiens]XP_011508103.1 protein-associating with the carboxyl-terminal domain of ezrin isoform X1 [Homo sapiens]Q8IZE3.3 RecName: Full=Protein-associating with the carboxyl-terminal domain of ezrin; AltName: Full=Ezrin-binding protein PACE-1; AltName: Full=SCY1-like protein 3 [Homo sapiens]KAI2520387.1 SCY1 like p|eukprot:NP_851607.2 protein-associating with the carboxyl-terminal domain of ezrin isoform 2 [Homo sapiens]
MGSENSALKSYTLREPPFTLPSGLAVYPAVLQDGKFASVFVYKRENEDKVNKAAKHLKTLRHPCLLRFLSCTVEADGIHLVTERVQPLEVALETLSSAEVCAGIYDILLALIFLHDRGHLTHNNVCLSSVFVSEDGHWKLGGMETVCKVSQATPEFLRSIQSIRDPASIPPEEMSPEFTTLPECHGHARDAFSFGTLVESLLTILNEQVSADVLSSFQQTLHSTLLNPIPKCRPALCTLLSHDFFRNDFLEVVNFLKSLTLKSEEEKTEFFKFLLDRVSCLSEELIASRLVPLLLNQLVFAEPVAVKSFLPYLLGPKKDHAQGETPCLLSPALFQSRVIPVLLQLFEVHEEHVRMVLLSHIEAYVEHFTQEQLKKVILPQVLLGLRDTSDSIVAITLHSLAVLVSLLGPEVVVGGERTKIFKRTAPSFTKNTDLSLEDSPMCVVCSHHSQISPILENPFSSIFPKCFFSGSTPINSKKHIQRDYYNTLLQTGDPFSQPIKFPINGLSDVKNTSEDSENFPSSSKKSEEWPDWSEPEEPENQTVNIQIWPREPCDDVKSQCTTLDVEESSWDDCEPSSLDTKVNPGGGITATKPVTSGEQKPIPALLSLTEESMPWKSSLPQKISLVQRGDDADQIEPPKVSSQERPLKVPSELGLGEEFTIQVKKKPVKDPEMDWFADMIPEIKPSAAFLILPELRTEMVPKKDDVSPVMQFSSKFAAAEITEGEAEGWEEEGELNWEDNNW